MYCRQCGYNNDNYTKICHRCGSNLREGTEEYGDAQAGPTEPGELKYARKQESFKEKLMIPFETLHRATPKERNKIAIIATASCAALGLLVLLIALLLSVKKEVQIDTYGNESGNVLQQPVVCADEEFIYYPITNGDNTGLFREPLDGGETLKLSWHTLSDMSAYQGWVYGVSESGEFLRISRDGAKVELVCEGAASFIQLFNGSVYFLDENGYILRIEIDKLGKNEEAKPEIIGDKRASAFCIDEAALYFIETNRALIEEEAQPVSGSDAIPVPTERSWRLIEEREGEDETVTSVVSINPEYEAGLLWSMLPDGSGLTQLTEFECVNFCVWDGGVYYMTLVERAVSATDVNPDAPPELPVIEQVFQCWRLNLKTMRYSRFMDEAFFSSWINPTESGFYYLDSDGNLSRVDPLTKEYGIVVTEFANVRRHCCTAGRIYYISYDGSSLAFTPVGSLTPESVC